MTHSAKTNPGKLVLIRHGQSEWNLKNLFTGWTDVDLTEQGVMEAKLAGRTLLEAGLSFDIAFTSVLARAIRTMQLIIDEMDLIWIPTERDWRLNERHYGALQGLNKAQTVAEHGADQVKIWRRSYDVPPPALADDDPRHPSLDPCYAHLSPSELPATESLKDTLARVEPYWRKRILPELRAGQNVLVAAHGNSLRALVKMLETISDSKITKLNIPIGVPRLYELDQDIRPIRAEYLGDSNAIAKAIQTIANQTKV